MAEEVVTIDDLSVWIWIRICFLHQLLLFEKKFILNCENFSSFFTQIVFVDIAVLVLQRISEFVLYLTSIGIQDEKNKFLLCCGHQKQF